jgi:asparagine synthase (glutamine-hydrolysing)
MCGIAGTLSPSPSEPGDRFLVERLCTALVHRGPDDAGIHADGPAVLGHRRLSILDLSAAGRQPFVNEDGRVAVAVNGEIYNHHELKRELVDRGHRFRSRSDSEVLVHLYEEEGERFVERLRGMFALALWDGHSGRLLLARDRFGKKPLYWRQGPRGLEFASELQALSGAGGSADLDLEALDLFLALQYIPSPRTVFRGVQKLPAGHLLRAAPGQMPAVRPYWRLSFAPAAPRPEPELVDELLRRLEEAVRVRLEADVPLGAFLSGGIDSSAVAALAARHVSGPLCTFTVRFEGDPAPELPFARLVARHLGARHEEVIVCPDLAGKLADLAGRYGEPYADASALPTYYLSLATRSQVTVALSGDGADEMLAGYLRYAHSQLGARLARLPGLLKRLVAEIGQRLPGARLEPLRRFAPLLLRSDLERYLRLVGFASAEERFALYEPDLAASLPGDAARDLFESISARSEAKDDLNRLLDLDVQTYLADCILPKVDIASMAHALEVRCPFLDPPLAEFLAGLPAEMKLRHGTGKYLLRQAMRGLLPRAILARPKRGFDPPLVRWLRGPLRPLLADALAGLGRRGLLRPAALADTLAAHDRGLNRANLLYALLMLELWFRAAVDGRTSRGAR